MTKDEIIKALREMARYPTVTLPRDSEALKSAADLLAQPEQTPVAWRYKPVRENNPFWEYTTKHPLDMGDGYLRPTLVEYCKCIEPLYAKEKPKLMLEKFREMKDLLDDTTPPPCQTCEALARTVMMDQTGRDA